MGRSPRRPIGSRNPLNDIVLSLSCAEYVMKLLRLVRRWIKAATMQLGDDPAGIPLSGYLPVGIEVALRNKDRARRRPHLM